jgi:hypothetical protein
MVETAWAVAAAAAFTWLGMVLAISFLEAPLKFRAPGITTRLGLGIGRIVFRAMNRVEVALLVVVLVAAGLGARRVVVPATALAVLLAAQLFGVRPGLNRRSDRVLAGNDAPRSRAHLVYVGLEAVKVVLLVAVGATALAG